MTNQIQDKQKIGGTKLLEKASFFRKLFPGSEPKLIAIPLLLKNTFHSYIRNVGVYLGIYFLTLLAAIIILGLGLISGRGMLRTGEVAVSPGFITLLISLAILLLVVYVWSQTAIFTAVAKAEKRIGIFEALKQSLPRTVPFFVITLLVSFIVIGGGVIFWIPGFIFWIWFLFAKFAYIDDGTEGFRALLLSRGYARGYWWPIFGRMIALMVLMLIAYCVFYFVCFAVARFGGGDPKAAFTTGFNFIFSYLMAPFVLTYIFVLYRNIKEIKGALIVTVRKASRIIYALFGILGVLAVFGLVYFTETGIEHVDRPNTIFGDNPSMQGVPFPPTPLPPGFPPPAAPASV